MSLSDFLSEALQKNLLLVKATINVYRPFIWIFAVEVLSLFYSLSLCITSQSSVGGIISKLAFAESDLLSVGDGTLCILGLVIGMISKKYSTLLIVNMYLLGYS